MTAFLLGVLSSLLATVLVLVAGWFRVGRPRWWLVGLLSRLTGTGITRLYGRQGSSEADLARDLARARWVKVLVGRGNVLTRDTFAPLWSGSPTPVQVLLPDPDSASGSWLANRGTDLGHTDPGFGPELLRAQVRVNIDYLDRVGRRNPALDLRLFDLPNTFRIIATDTGAYLTFYSRYEHGRHSPCLHLTSSGTLYDAALGLFEFAWANSAAARGGDG
ncbi:hypothetical protein [Nocardiopsis sp. L17-MgMaSL7]|uniref:hypothetical protein n=1 Tax=Nocardiopsis sp. L17-MgMaSL7 TaxID=1938893 RepID=UPI000D713B28|nr:hypothetical protein [Nocardiopsis sp. L17-MgMaSL7]PWV47365.1 hypothetical protein BDW27_112163 [Nocardiopsis sp. L17-MgMaSL7]